MPAQTVAAKNYPIFDQFGYQPGTGVDASGYLHPFRLAGGDQRVAAATDHTAPPDSLRVW